MMDNTSQSPQLVAGRYRVDRLIARGGMGSVFLCHDLELPRPVAVKVLRPGADAEGSGRFVDRFHLEAKTLASLNHNNIVTLYDYGQTDDGQFYLALEYIEGPRFTDLVRQGPMAAERASELILQVCRALRYAHKRGVVHRDLKPSNLLIRVDDDGEEHVKVVDFGLVKVLEGDDQSLTRAGLILGSPHCMAPEQIRGQDVDHRSDIYAIGILLFRAVVGSWPFHGDSSTATMIAHINQPIPAFAEANVDLVVPDGFENIVRRCLQKRPEDRYADVPALMRDLRTMLGRQQTITVSEGPPVGEPSIVTGSRSALRSLGTATVPEASASHHALHEHSNRMPAVQEPRRSPLVAAGVGAVIMLLLLLSCSGMFLLGQYAAAPGPVVAPAVPAPAPPAGGAEVADPEPVEDAAEAGAAGGAASAPEDGPTDDPAEPAAADPAPAGPAASKPAPSKPASAKPAAKPTPAPKPASTAAPEAPPPEPPPKAEDPPAEPAPEKLDDDYIHPDDW
jgi:serine/threonine-protein kinase